MADSGGSGLPACRRAPARRGAGERKFLRQSCQAGFDRIPFDVARDPPEFIVTANEVVVILVLPKRTNQPEHSNCFVTSESFERAEPFPEWDPGRHEQMHVIRHDDKSVQMVALEAHGSVTDSFNNHLCCFRLIKKERSAFRVIEQAIHRDKRMPGGQVGVWELPASWQASIEPKRDERSPANDIVVGKATVVAHRSVSWHDRRFVSADLRTIPAGPHRRRLTGRLWGRPSGLRTSFPACPAAAGGGLP